MTLRSCQRLKALNGKLSQDWKGYTLCRNAMLNLPGGHDSISCFKEMARSDLRTSTAIQLPNLRGISSSQLSWIWQFRASEGAPTGANECKFDYIQ